MGGGDPHLIQNAECPIHYEKSWGSKSPILQSLKASDIPVVSEIEFASKYTKATLIGITGSNGKTTTAMMTYKILDDAGYDVALAGTLVTVLPKRWPKMNINFTF